MGTDTLRGCSVLLVDDSEVGRIVVSRMLQSCGAEVTVAADGQEAIDRAKLGCFSLILMDVNMPVRDGLSATRAIRSFQCREKRSRTPIVALSASTMAQDRQACLEAGMDDFLGKPVDSRSLVAAVDRWASGAPIRATGSA